MAKNMEVATLYDHYGDLLTDKQRDMIEQYYFQDLSLSEIAENAGISRQGVRDSVKRAENQLFEMEEHLGVAAYAKKSEEALAAILAACGAIRASEPDAAVLAEVDRITALTTALIDR